MTDTHQTSGVTESMMDHATQSCPWAFYRQLHEHAPVYRVPENGAYIVSTYELLRDTLGDPERFSNRSFSAAGLQADRVKRQQEILAERGLAARGRAAAHRPAGAHPLPAAAQPGVHAAAVAELTPRIDESCTSHRPLHRPRRVRLRERLRPAAAGHPHRRAAGPAGRDPPTFRRLGRRHARHGAAAAHAEAEAKRRPRSSSRPSTTWPATSRSVAAEPRDDLISALVHAHDAEATSRSP